MKICITEQAMNIMLTSPASANMTISQVVNHILKKFILQTHKFDFQIECGWRVIDEFNININATILKVMNKIADTENCSVEYLISKIIDIYFSYNMGNSTLGYSPDHVKIKVMFMG